MNMSKETRLLDEREALTCYLDSLLREIPAADAAVALADPPGMAQPPQACVVERPSAQASPPTVPVVSGPPEWASGSFQCLAIQVSGLTLAVPLVKLNGVIEMPGDITPMPGHQPWFLGLTQHLGRQVKVVDIGRIVLPEGRPYTPVVPSRIVLMDDSRWGIACEGETRMISLSAEGVRWRTSRGKRPWLAGTVIEHMCAILDVDVLASDLTSGQWSAAAVGRSA